MDDREKLIELKNAALAYVAKINKVTPQAKIYQLIPFVVQQCPVARQARTRTVWHGGMSATEVCSTVECPLFDAKTLVFHCVPYPAPTSANRATRLQAFINFIAYVNVLLDETRHLDEQNKTP